MRRKDREVVDFKRMKEIAERCDCLRLGLKDEDGVYIVPLSFGMAEEDGKLVFYFHSAPEGNKINLIRAQSNVSFEMDCGHQLTAGGETACTFGYKYQSIMGKGNVSLVADYDEKIRGLQLLMRHYTEKNDWTFKDGMVNHVAVLKLTVEEWTCKVCE